jgi:hypothetical protein
MEAKLVKALGDLEEALNHVKRASADSVPDSARYNLRKSKRGIEDAMQRVKRAIRELPD